MKKRKIIITLIIICFVGLIFYVFNNDKTKELNSYNVGLVYLVEHPAINQALQGFKQELKIIENETGSKFNVTYSNAYGEPKNVNGIISTFTQGKTDVIISLTTPCAQIAKKLVKNEPVIFVGVSDPIGAGLVASLDQGEKNITGTTSKDPNFETLELAVKIFPKMSKVGIIYTSSESNSVSILSSLEEKIKNNNLEIKLIKKSISNTIEILPATNALLNEVDAIFLINDNTVISSVELILKLAKEKNKPIFSSDIESVKKGALFTFGLDYKDEGVATAKILRQIIIDNKKPSEIPIYINEKYYLYVNSDIEKYVFDKSFIENAVIVDK